MNQPQDDPIRVALPRDLTRLTPTQVEWCVAYHAALPLAEIRRRQGLAERQIGLAWRQRNEFALANLRVREEILRRAAERKLPWTIDRLVYKHYGLTDAEIAIVEAAGD